jgi:excisionase family DNA binding protein
MNHHASATVPTWLLIAEAARALRVSEWTVRRWVRDGRLRTIRPGHRRLVAREDVERLVAMPPRVGAPVAPADSGSGNP